MGVTGILAGRHEAQGAHQPQGDKRVQQKIWGKARIIWAPPLNRRASINIDPAAAPWLQQLAARCLEAQGLYAVRRTVQRGIAVGVGREFIAVCGQRGHRAQCGHASQEGHKATHGTALLQATHPPTGWSAVPIQKSPAPSPHAWRGPCFPCGRTERTHRGSGRPGPGRCSLPMCPTGCQCR